MHGMEYEESRNGVWRIEWRCVPRISSGEGLSLISVEVRVRVTCTLWSSTWEMTKMAALPTSWLTLYTTSLDSSCQATSQSTGEEKTERQTRREKDGRRVKKMSIRWNW